MWRADVTLEGKIAIFRAAQPAMLAFQSLHTDDVQQPSGARVFVLLGVADVDVKFDLVSGDKLDR